jgi:hypothetical protein
MMNVPRWLGLTTTWRGETLLNRATQMYLTFAAPMALRQLLHIAACRRNRTTASPNAARAPAVCRPPATGESSGIHTPPTAPNITTACALRALYFTRVLECG